MRVLLVEDEDALAETLAAGLRADGFAVDIARDGVQALTRIHGTQYDAMVLDIMLPGLSGYEAEFGPTPMCFSRSDQTRDRHSDVLDQSVWLVGPILAP
jgi:hypothetical protein